jgi:hypothetical protein
MPLSESDFRYGSCVDIGPRLRQVRFTPDSGHCSRLAACQLSAGISLADGR